VSIVLPITIYCLLRNWDVGKHADNKYAQQKFWKHIWALFPLLHWLDLDANITLKLLEFSLLALSIAGDEVLRDHPVEPLLQCLSHRTDLLFQILQLLDVFEFLELIN
jgi:hypothetical protein